jgi:2-polyprenyl-6-methoxyphenol hydroxylase-like FAD-dependent oxidoreductase
VRVAINGIGVAGPTLAWWLRRYGHEPVLFEKAPRLRTGGYLIDFGLAGYDVADRMGLVPALQEKGYRMQALRMLDARGRTLAGAEMGALQSLIQDRYVSIARGDLAATIFHACAGVEARFGNSVVGIEQQEHGVTLRTSDGSEEVFDLVIGAGGLHSHIRALAFGPEARFEHPVGCCVAAFALPGYRPRDELVYVTHTVLRRMVGRVALRDDITMFLLVFGAELLASPPASAREQREALRGVFDGMGWEVPQILSRMDEVEDLYFDVVSQIRMDHWTTGRVALVGDAAACVSLLGGEGAGLAMLEAYVLAGELHRAGGDHTVAFQQYETILRPFLKQKQKTALRSAGFFAPRSSWELFLYSLAVRAMAVPGLARLLFGRALRDFDLPDYEKPAGEA